MRVQGELLQRNLKRGGSAVIEPPPPPAPPPPEHIAIRAMLWDGGDGKTLLLLTSVRVWSGRGSRPASPSPLQGAQPEAIRAI